MPGNMRKITVVGGGAVGATLAQRILEGGIADVVLIDIMKNLACGKAYDLLDAAPILSHECNIIGTDDYKYIEGSEIVVVTAGLARKPGMTREDLVQKNAAIVKDVCLNIKKYAPKAIVIIVTNPLDTMTYLAYKTTGFEKGRVLGMAGVLDGSRFIQLIASELKVKRSEVETYVLGSHGDTMVPVISHTTVNKKPIADVMSPDRLQAIVKRTCDRGAEIVSLFGTGSAYYSPSAAVLKMIKAIIGDTKEILAISAVMEGEYGLSGLAVGIPCQIGRKGIDHIVELKLSQNEIEALNRSAKAIKSSLELL